MKNLKFLWIITLIMNSIFLFGQDIQVNEKIPVDPKIRTGKLDNGFTYYIRQNHKPENRFELRLAVNAGSILEDDDQRGLAHFVEHMCFNGTKNFEKNDLIKYLESMGIKFGPEINAYTSFDETVYMLSVPSDSADLVEKSFLIMEDWAHNVSFEDEEIDKERGVVIEEWRLGQGPNQRLMEKFLPVVLQGSRYADRLPIGEKDILENFKYNTLKRFYKDWYRPDLMALVVVGDIDPDVAEKKIKAHFSNLKMPDDPRDRKEYGVPDHNGTLVSIAKDKEAPYTLVRLMYKSDTIPEITGSDYINKLKYTFITGMLNRRLSELTEKAEPPFLGAGFYYGNLFARSKNALQGYAVVADTAIDTGLESILTENRRVAEYGFTQGELERFKLDMLKSMEQAYNERDKTESDKLADEYVRNFLTKEPIPGISWEYNILKENINHITLSDINALASSLIKDDNNIVVVTGPDKKGLKFPDKEEVFAMEKTVEKSDISPYEDKLAGSELMNKMPERGKIVSEKNIESVGVTELKLSNGATVVLKPTDFKNDEILMTAFAWGGTSIYPDKDFYSAINADGIVSESGVGDFSPSDLTKLLAGKSVGVGTSLSKTTENISGNCRAEDFETMLQLTYMNMTTPRIDKESFISYINKYKNYYKNLKQEPTNYFYDQYNRIKNQNHPRGNYLPEEGDWDKVDFNRAIEIYKDRFGDASEFTFVFVGSFKVDEVKPLIAEYIGGLPSLNRNEKYRDLGIRSPEGMVDKKVFKGEDPKSRAIISFDMEVPYNREDAFLFSQLGQHLSRRYTEVLREEMSGIYGMSVRANLNQVPYDNANLTLVIPCSPDNVDSLVAAAIDEIKDIQENGVKDEDIVKAKEIYKREKEKKLQENNFWLGALKSYYMYGYDLSDIPSFDRVNEITSKEFQRVARKYINLDDYIKVVLYPETMESKK